MFFKPTLVKFKIFKKLKFRHWICPLPGGLVLAPGAPSLILLWFKDEYGGRWVVKILTFDRCFELYKPVSSVTTSKDFVWFPVIYIGGMGDKVIFKVAVGTSFCRIDECVQNIT